MIECIVESVCKKSVISARTVYDIGSEVFMILARAVYDIGSDCL